MWRSFWWTALLLPVTTCNAVVYNIPIKQVGEYHVATLSFGGENLDLVVATQVTRSIVFPPVDNSSDVISSFTKIQEDRYSTHRLATGDGVNRMFSAMEWMYAATEFASTTSNSTMALEIVVSVPEGFVEHRDGVDLDQSSVLESTFIWNGRFQGALGLNYERAVALSAPGGNFLNSLWEQLGDSLDELVVVLDWKPPAQLGQSLYVGGFPSHYGSEDVVWSDNSAIDVPERHHFGMFDLSLCGYNIMQSMDYHFTTATVDTETVSWSLPPRLFYSIMEWLPSDCTDVAALTVSPGISARRRGSEQPSTDSSAPPDDDKDIIPLEKLFCKVPEGVVIEDLPNVQFRLSMTGRWIQARVADMVLPTDDGRHVYAITRAKSHINMVLGGVFVRQLTTVLDTAENRVGFIPQLKSPASNNTQCAVPASCPNDVAVYIPHLNACHEVVECDFFPYMYYECPETVVSWVVLSVIAAAFVGLNAIAFKFERKNQAALEEFAQRHTGG